MQLPRDVLGYDFAQAALVGGVDILVGAGDDLEGAGQPLLLDLGPAGLDSLELVLGQAAGLCVCAGEGDGADDVLVVADIVEGEGLVVLLHKGVEAASEATSLQHVLLARCHRHSSSGVGRVQLTAESARCSLPEGSLLWGEEGK